MRYEASLGALPEDIGALRPFTFAEAYRAERIHRADA
jgi:hypothetical protein